jgi:predicted nucleotidyltransferase
VSTHPAVAEIDALTSLLLEREVDFILIGGAAAMVHGSPTGTQDYDIVHSRAPANVERLIAILVNELDAYFRSDLSGRRLVPTASHLAGKGQILLTTRLGPFDLPGTLHDGRGYDELLPHTTAVDFDGRPLRVLDLATLIEVKTAAGRPKDKVVVADVMPILERLKKPPGK